MRRFIAFCLAAGVSLAIAASALAVAPGKTLEFDGKGGGTVVFDGKVHADKGLKCADCHQSGLFRMKKGADIITMKDMNEGKFCGACHNGTKVFGTKDPANCSRCHKK